VPLNQHIEGGHGEGQARLKYAQPRCLTFFTWQTSVSIESTVSTSIRSCTLRADTFQVAGIPSAAWKPVSLRTIIRHQPAASAIARCCPRHWRWHTPTPRSTPLIEQQTKFAPTIQRVIREAFATNLLGTPAFAHGVNQLDAVGVK